MRITKLETETATNYGFKHVDRENGEVSRERRMKETLRKTQQ